MSSESVVWLGFIRNQVRKCVLFDYDGNTEFHRYEY